MHRLGKLMHHSGVPITVHLWQHNLLSLSLSSSACTASLRWHGRVASLSLLLLASHGAFHGIQQ